MKAAFYATEASKYRKDFFTFIATLKISLKTVL